MSTLCPRGGHRPAEDTQATGLRISTGLRSQLLCSIEEAFMVQGVLSFFWPMPGCTLLTTLSLGAECRPWQALHEWALNEATMVCVAGGGDFQNLACG